MAHIRYEDKQVELAEDWRIGELIEAENALSIDMDSAKGAARIALVVFISIRRTDKQTPTGVVADKVLRMNLSALAQDDDEEGEASPLDNGDAAPEIGGRLTSGSQPTATGST